MYERAYGYQYEQVREYASAAEIAKAIRADIKTAKAEGLLPTQWAYSVRSDNFAGGCSVDVTVKNCPDAWQDCDGSIPGTRSIVKGVHGDYETYDVCHDVWCAGRAERGYEHGAQVHRTLTAEARAAKMTLERIHGAYNHDGSDAMVDYFDVRYYGTVQFDWRCE